MINIKLAVKNFLSSLAPVKLLQTFAEVNDGQNLWIEIKFWQDCSDGTANRWKMNKK